MEQKVKFIIIGLVGFCILCLLLFIHSASEQQKLIRESTDLKTENTTLTNKASKLENDLKENQGRINALTAERDRSVEELNALQKKLDAATSAREELIQKLKEKSLAQQVQPVSVPPPPQEAPAPQNNDAYWATVLKAKNELEMQLADIRAELKNQQAINVELRNEKRKTEAEIRLEGQLVDVRSELKDLQISNESLRREKGILEIDLNNARNEKKDLLRQMDYNQKLLDSMSQDVVRERNDKLAIMDNFKSTKSSNSVLLRQVKSLTNRKILLDKKVQELAENKSSLEKQLVEMEKMMAGRSSKINALKNELETVKNEDTEAPNKGSVELPAIVVHPGATSAEKPKVQLQEAGGKILAVNLESNFVVIDSGSSSGVKVGDVYKVYRNEQEIGTVSVIQTRDAISACDIKKMSSAFKIGDQIKK